MLKAKETSKYPCDIEVLNKYLLNSEGVQDTPPQNMLLWDIDYFELKPMERQLTRGEDFSELPSSV